MSDPISEDELDWMRRAVHNKAPTSREVSIQRLIARLDAAELKLAAAEAELEARDFTIKVYEENFGPRLSGSLADRLAAAEAEAERQKGFAATYQVRLVEAKAEATALREALENAECECGGAPHIHVDGYTCPALAAYDRALSTTPEEPE